MSNKNTDNLFSLIKSLSKSEKRYFRLYAQQHQRKGKSNYLLLFDALDSQTDYDEAKILRKFKGEKFLRNLASTKYQLLNLIMKSLRAFHAGESAEMKIREELDNVEILFRKGLLKLCKRALARAESIAEFHENYPYLLQVMDWKSSLLTREEKRFSKKPFEIHLTRKKEVLDKLQNTFSYSILSSEIFGFGRVKSRVRTEEELARLNKIMESEELQDYSLATTFQSKIRFLECHGLFHIFRGNYREGFQYFKRNSDLWDENPHFIEMDEAAYLYSVSNLISCSMFSEEYDEFMAAIGKLQNFKASFPLIEARAKTIGFFHELIYYMNFGGFERGLELVHKIEAWLEGSEAFLADSKYLAFLYNITVFFFLYGEYSNALKWLNRILYYDRVEMRQDIQDFARIFQLIIHHELGNLDLLDYLFRSTYRYLRKRDKLLEYEQLLINYIRNSSRYQASGEMIDAFKTLKMQFEELGSRPGVRKPVGLQELIFWLESKIQGISMRELYESKIREKTESKDTAPV